MACAERSERLNYAIECKDEWAGILLPEWIRFFDCRAEDSRVVNRTSWGASLMGSERAAVDLGLRGDGFFEDTVPLSCSTYIDARTCSEQEIARQLQDAIKAAEKLRKEYQDAVKNPAKPNQGGSCCYEPLAICISNYGWSIVADRRVYAVRGFE